MSHCPRCRPRHLSCVGMRGLHVYSSGNQKHLTNHPTNQTSKQVNRLEDDWPESIFAQVLIQPRRHLFTSLRRACLHAALLNAYGNMRPPSHHPSFLSNCAARFLTKVVCASCIVPGCCAQVALCKLLHASALCKLLCASALSKLLCASALRQLLRASALLMCSVQVGGLCKLLCARCSVQALCACALCKLLCASALSKLLCASALRQLLRASALRCASALCNCSVQVALRKLLCASDSAQVALRKCCRSCGNVLRVLFLYLKVAIFQPELRGCAPRTTCVLKSCDFPA